MTILVPPSDEETFSIPPIERMIYCMTNQLDMKYFPEDEEIDIETENGTLSPNLMLILSFKLKYLPGITNAFKRGADIYYLEKFRKYREIFDDKDGDISYDIFKNKLKMSDNEILEYCHLEEMLMEFFKNSWEL